MRIIDAEWGTVTVNILIIKCEECRRLFNHRSDRWHVYCPGCGAMDKLDVLRARYVEEEDGGA